jgi:5-methyltetrahydrofolate--homocysteine methyltransferase
MSQFLDTLAHRVLIYDGAMGTAIQRYQLSAEDYGGQATEGCNEYLALTRIKEEMPGVLMRDWRLSTN